MESTYNGGSCCHIPFTTASSVMNSLETRRNIPQEFNSSVTHLSSTSRIHSPGTWNHPADYVCPHGHIFGRGGRGHEYNRGIDTSVSTPRLRPQQPLPSQQTYYTHRNEFNFTKPPPPSTSSYRIPDHDCRPSVGRSFVSANDSYAITSVSSNSNSNTRASSITTLLTGAGAKVPWKIVTTLIFLAAMAFFVPHLLSQYDPPNLEWVVEYFKTDEDQLISVDDNNNLVKQRTPILDNIVGIPPPPLSVVEEKDTLTVTVDEVHQFAPKIELPVTVDGVLQLSPKIELPITVDKVLHLAPKIELPIVSPMPEPITPALVGLTISELEEKMEAKIQESLHELERIFEQRLADALKESQKQSMSAYLPVQPMSVDETIVNTLREEMKAYAANLINAKECTLICPPLIPDSKPVDVGGTVDIDNMIKVALGKYDSDKTGRPDMALESAGGSIVSTRCTQKSNYVGSQISIFNIPLWFPSNNPRTAIQPGNMPGDCWSFDGSEGFLVIKLVGPTRVTGFTLEHTPKIVTPHGHIQSAPRRFQVVGHLDYDDFANEFLFGEYEYLDDGNAIQYFSVDNNSETFYPYVELKILSNHGSVAFTCLYRFRVHGILEGTLIPSQMIQNTEQSN